MNLRSLLGGSAALLATAGTTTARAAPNADAELLAACEQVSILQRQIIAAYSDGAHRIDDDHERDAFIEPIEEAQEPLLERICALRATTPEGIRAKLRVLLLWDAELRGGGYEPLDWDQRLVLSLVDEVRAEEERASGMLLPRPNLPADARCIPLPVAAPSHEFDGVPEAPAPLITVEDRERMAQRDRLIRAAADLIPPRGG